jgi:hypothetical protein
MTDKTFREYEKEMKDFADKIPLVKGLQENLTLKLDVTEEEMIKYCYQFDKLVFEFSQRNPILATELSDAIFKMDAPERVKLYLAVKALEIISERKKMDMMEKIIRKMKEEMDRK